MSLLVLRPGRLVRVTEHGANESVAMIHGRKFSIRNAEIERVHGNVHVVLRLNCCHCSSFLSLQFAMSEELCLLNGRYSNSGGSIFVYNSAINNGDDKCLVIDEDLYAICDLSRYIDINYYSANPCREVQSNPNILFQMRVGRK